MIETSISTNAIAAIVRISRLLSMILSTIVLPKIALLTRARDAQKSPASGLDAFQHYNFYAERK